MISNGIEKRRPAPLHFNKKDDRSVIDVPPTAYLAPTPHPLSAFKKSEGNIWKTDSLHANAFKYYSKFDSCNCQLIIPIDDSVHSIKRSRSFSNLLDTPTPKANSRRSSEILLNGSNNNEPRTPSFGLNFDIPSPAPLINDDSIMCWPPLTPKVEEFSPTPRASFSAVNPLRKSSLLSPNVATDFSHLKKDDDNHLSNVSNNVSNKNDKHHPKLLVLHLHKEYLSTQSLLFKTIFTKLDEQQSQDNYEVKVKTEECANEARKIFSENDDTKIRLGSIPRVLDNGAIYLPIPDPQSLLYLIQAIYLGHGPYLEHHLDINAVKWEGLVQNSEYLSIDPWIKRVLGRWWYKHVKRSSDKSNERKLSHSYPYPSPRLSESLPFSQLNRRLSHGRQNTPTSNSFRRSSGHVRQSLRDYNLNAANRYTLTPKFTIRNDIDIDSNEIDDYQHPPSPKTEESLVKRLRNI